MIIIASREEKDLLKWLRELGPDSPDKAALSADILNLKQQLADLEIKKSKQKEDHEKQERELRHMIGLEKKRQEFEITQAKKETSLSVREGNLEAEQKRFTENLKFNTERFETMETYLKDMMGKILERLPHVESPDSTWGRKK